MSQPGLGWLDIVAGVDVIRLRVLLSQCARRSGAFWRYNNTKRSTSSPCLMV
ncbi:MAG: hypothetical protein IPM16_18100 [Chloroflexi bacterium]|nr:hypothetical protein [Chloroflexota bacterium]